MGRWQILRSATEQTLAALLQQSKVKNLRRKNEYIERLEPRTLLNGSLLKDIDITPAMEGVFWLTHMPGSSTYYFTNTDSDGRELWKSDGTESGTVKVKDIDPGRSSSTPHQFMPVGSTLFFAATTSAGKELWKSDGTESGTVMVKDIYAESGNADPMMITAVGSTLYFTAKSSGNGRELWVSDGSSSGTFMLKDIYSGANDSNVNTGDFAILDGELYFSAQSGDYGTELWKSDGTSSGTVMVKDIVADSGSSNPSNLFVFDDLLYFSADDGTNGYELWQSDGSETGTALFKNINAGGSSSSNPNEFFIFDDELYFRATTDTYGNELWKTDGSYTGTVQVKDINPDSAWSSPGSFIIMDEKLYFTATTADDGQELWVTDGTSSGTVQVKDINDSGSNSSNPQNLVVIDDEVLYFTATGGSLGTELWKSDGTETGTVQVKDIVADSGGSWPMNLTNVDGTLFFTANTSADGTELWMSDGSCSGTVMVKDIWSGSQSSSPISLLANGATLYFVATNDTYGVELWKSDGTETGTVVVKDVNTGTHHSDPQNFISVGNVVYFSANDNVNGHELWKTDGTDAGTILVKDIWSGQNSSSPSNFVAIDNVIYFTADTESEGRELWKSDGTSSGTVLVKDINPYSSSWPETLRVMGNAIYFTAATPSAGRELWKSDGTSSGTVMVKDINPGSSESQIETNLVVMEGLLYLSASNSTYGRELYVSDGTCSGTVVVKDIVSGSTGSNPNRLVVMDDVLYFSANTSADGTELWKSDGTETGTVQVKDIVSGSSSSDPDELTTVGSTLYFKATTSSEGSELWKSDGTSSGTVLVKDIESGSSGSNPDDFIANGNRLFFFADTTPKGKELWVSDGTSSGTVLVKDINDGATSTNPSTMILVNRVVYLSVNEGWSNSVWHSDGSESGTWRVQDNTGSGQNSIIGFYGSIIFSADDGTHGRELWMTPPPLIATFDPVASETLISWTPIGGATSFTLERSDDGEDWDELGTFDTTSFVDPNGQPGHFYNVNMQPIGDYPISAETEAVEIIPTSISVEVTEVGDHGSGEGILLEWENNFPGLVQSWSIKRKRRCDAGWLPIVTLPGSANSYLDLKSDEWFHPEYFFHGTSFEYCVESLAVNSYPGAVKRTAGYVYAGWDTFPVHSRGQILLIVDGTKMPSTGETFEPEYKRFKEDLIGDGWQVIEQILGEQHIVDVPLDLPEELLGLGPNGWPEDPGELEGIVEDTFGPWKGAVEHVKGLVESANNLSGDLNAILLIGDVPVPYSGRVPIDGHPEEEGAQPVDLYYGVIDSDSVWTDNEYLFNRYAEDPGDFIQRRAHHNFPGDGKFDFDTFYTPAGVPVDIPVSRIDFSDMWVMEGQDPDGDVGTADDLTEMELYKAYFDKNHAYRHGEWDVGRQAVVERNGAGYSQHYFQPMTLSFEPAQFSPLVGRSNIEYDGRFAQSPYQGVDSSSNHVMQSTGTNHSLNNDSWLWAYVGSGGWFQVDDANYDYLRDLPHSNYVSTYNYADPDDGVHKGVFNVQFGSFIRMWDKPNSFLRSPIADPDGLGLTSVWGTNWLFHGMGLGEPIAGSMLKSINDYDTYSTSATYTLPPLAASYRHTLQNSLQGDLTLHQDTFESVTNVQARTWTLGHSGNIHTVVTWDPPAIEGLGYYVYRADLEGGAMECLNEGSPIYGEPRFVDFDSPDAAYYMVRATRLEETPSGTYWNLSNGVVTKNVRTIDTADFDWSDGPQRWIFEVYPELALENLEVSIAGQKWDNSEEEFEEVEFTFEEDFGVDYNETTDTVTVEFLGESEFGVAGTLPSGRYTVLLSADIESEGGLIPGSDFKFDVVFVAGDTDGDGDVDSTDLSVVTNNQNETELDWDSSFQVGDFDNDGDVDEDDLDILDELYGLDLN